MPVNILIREIMWEYDCTKKRAKWLVDKYRKSGKYLDLCEIVKYKRSAPDFNKEEFV